MFRIDLEVRGCELDAQRVVNNAAYQNYLGHARHKYLAELGINFVELAESLRVDNAFSKTNTQAPARRIGRAHR